VLDIVDGLRGGRVRSPLQVAASSLAATLYCFMTNGLDGASGFENGLLMIHAPNAGASRSVKRSR
jgi:hypothetical protein